jgi:hypothetical protein
MAIRTLNLDSVKELTYPHDEVMKTPLVIVEGYHDSIGRYSVKVPESFTFVEFKSHWDQDQYIHNDKAEDIVKSLGLVRGEGFEVLHDYPRYSDKSVKLCNALRFFFKDKIDANDFIIAMKCVIMMDRRERKAIFMNSTKG